MMLHRHLFLGALWMASFILYYGLGWWIINPMLNRFHDIFTLC